MRINICIFSNCEIASSAFTQIPCYGDYMFKIHSTTGTSEAMKFDMGDCEDVVDENRTLNDISDGFQYNEITLTKAQFGQMMKKYLKNIEGEIKKKENQEEYIEGFKKNATEFCKFVMSKFEEFQFYMNSENDSEGAFMCCYWENPETDKGPTFFFFKDGLKIVKY